MNMLHFDFENLLTPMLQSGFFVLLVCVGSLYLWFQRRPSPLLRKVRVSRDVTPYRRSSR